MELKAAEKNAGAPSNPLARNLRSHTKPGEFRMSLSTGMLMYETRGDGSLSAEFFPLDQWRRSYQLESSGTGEITSITMAQRTSRSGGSLQGASSILHEDLSKRSLAADSEEWRGVLERLRVGFSIYGSGQ